MRAWLLSALILCCGVVVMGVVAAGRTVASNPPKVMGPNACAECHKMEVEAWQQTHHFKTFREMPRRKEANEIAGRMGISRIRGEGLCLTCHYTVQDRDNARQPVAGISCESCHGAGEEWIKVHSGYSGKTEKTETKAEKDARWKLSVSKGMIRPSAVYRLAQNCYGCHVVPHEDLVNKGGHPAGSTFDLVAWSQGEVRHNTWHSKGKANVPATAARKRLLYLIGLGVELETVLRAIGRATSRKLYAFEMAQRVDRSRKQLALEAKAAPAVPEIAQLVEFSYAAGLKLRNESHLTAAADGVSKLLVAIAEKYDGSTMAGLDAMIPAANKFKGKVRAAGASN